MSKLSEAVMEKLGEAIELWAEENLPGRPAILAYNVYRSVEKCLLNQQEEIEKTFPLQEETGDD